MIKTYKLVELAKKYNVCVKTIHNWKKAGKFIPVEFKYRSNTHIRWLDKEDSLKLLN